MAIISSENIVAAPNDGAFTSSEHAIFQLLELIRSRPMSLPRVGVCAIIFPRHPCGAVDFGHVLMVQRGRAPAAGLWAFPGGRLEAGERLRTAAVRETAEETGLIVEVPVRRVELAAQEVIVPGTATHFVLAHVVGTWPWCAGAAPPAAGDDAAEAAWVATGAVSALPLLPPPPLPPAPTSLAALRAAGALVDEVPEVLQLALASFAAPRREAVLA